MNDAKKSLNSFFQLRVKTSCLEDLKIIMSAEPFTFEIKWLEFSGETESIEANEL